jgi:hypothetical protein
MTSLCMLPPAPVARGAAEDGQLAQERSVALGCQRVRALSAPNGKSLSLRGGQDLNLRLTDYEFDPARSATCSDRQKWRLIGDSHDSDDFPLFSGPSRGRCGAHSCDFRLDR